MCLNTETNRIVVDEPAGRYSSRPPMSFLALALPLATRLARPLANTVFLSSSKSQVIAFSLSLWHFNESIDNKY